MATNREQLVALYNKYELTPDEVFKHSHYTIITRAGIDKIQALEKIKIRYEVVDCRPDFAAVKASAEKGEASIQTFGSALFSETVTEVFKRKVYIKNEKDKNGDPAYEIVDDVRTIRIGNCTNSYIMEMAEKRAMSRAVLKLTGFYELGVFGEDESDDFKRK